MLATLVDQPFSREGWVFEEKYDGVRMLAYKEGPRVIADFSQRNRPFRSLSDRRRGNCKSESKDAVTGRRNCSVRLP